MQTAIRHLPSHLYAVADVDAAAAAGWRPVDLVRAFVAGGATLLQLRAKRLASGAFLEVAAGAAEVVHSAGATLVVNDRADIARLSDADGVHVGQDDLSPEAVRRVVGETTLVGVSTHTTEQLERAIAAPVNYVALGPVFSTHTKETGYDAVGLEMVRRAAAAAAARHLPLVAIGGVTLDRARAVLDAGAASVAVIGDLLAGGDPERRVREFIRTLDERQI